MDSSTRLAVLIDELVSSKGPGIAVAAYTDGAMIWQACGGLASVEFEVPVDADTRFDIASMSKQFTAAAALLLCRDGRLSLDDDIRTHLPELCLAQKVTIGQCLRHTAGLPDYIALSHLTGRTLSRITQDQALAFIAPVTTLDFEPETELAYSNSGYVLIASVIQRITGVTLRQFAEERIFHPLGMAETFFRDDSHEVIPRLAYGYQVFGASLSRADSEESLVGDGALVTSIADLAPWYGFLQDGRVLGADIRDGMLARIGPPGAEPRDYALGLSHTSIDGHPVFGHAGGVRGYRSQLLFMPDRGLGIAMLTNNPSIDPGPVGARLLRIAAGLPDEEPIELAADSPVAGALAGSWWNPDTDLFFEAEVDNGRVLVSGGWPSGRFAIAPDDAWHSQDMPGLRLRLDGDTLLLHHLDLPGGPWRYVRRSAPAADAVLTPGAYRSSELGTLITIKEDGIAELGLSIVAPVEPAPGGMFSVAGFALREDRGDLLVSTMSMTRRRFVRQTDGTAPVGVPFGLNVAT